MNTLLPLLIVTVGIGLISGVVIWIVGRLGFGLEVNHFGSAVIAGLVIAFVAGLITLLLGLSGIEFGEGLSGGIVHLIISVIAIMVSGKFLPGFKITGFVGVLVASVVIGAVYWLGGLALGVLI